MIAAQRSADGPRVEVHRVPRRRRMTQDEVVVARDVFIAVKYAQGATQARIGGMLGIAQNTVSDRLKAMPAQLRRGAEALVARYPDGIPEAMTARLEELAREERQREKAARHAARLVKRAGLPL